MCGDYGTGPSRPFCNADTTPRVRGLHIIAVCRVVQWRYNPACAGTTGRSPPCRALTQIQPRVCGDYVFASSRNSTGIDTTPRVRGLLSRFVLSQVPTRYNPACAGTTGIHADSCNPMAIQPRVCGDYFRRSDFSKCLVDTTPRVRGLRDAASDCPCKIRYNPACAGTTCLV